MAFASVEDYTNRYGSVADEGMLLECLDDCSALMESEMDRRGVSYANPSYAMADRLMRVCRSMAYRIMPKQDATDVPVGATQMSVTAGSYTQSVTFGATYGTPKMLDADYRMLGIGGARIGFGAMAGKDD